MRRRIHGSFAAPALPLIILLFVPSGVRAQARGCWGEARRTAPIELTEKDFSKLPRFCSLDMAVYGVRLGMTAPQALLALHQYEFAVKEDHETLLGRTFHNIRVMWEKREIVTIAVSSDKVDQIVLQPGMALYLSGDSARLFESEMADRDSPLRRRYFGREDRMQTEGYEPVTTVSYIYGAEGLEVRCIRIAAAVGNKVIGNPQFRISLALTYPEKKRS